MLQISNIELSDTAIGANGGEYISFSREMNVIDFFIVGDELSKDGGFFNVPDGAGGIDGAGAY